MTPRRIQRRRTAGWRMPEGTVYVGRPTRWGNPHIVSTQMPAWVAVEFYRHDLHGGRLPLTVADVRRELAERDLACWCREGLPCHADVLLAVANDRPL